MTSTKKRITAALTAAILTTTLAIPAMATEAPDEPVRVSSYKGSTPGGQETVADSSSAPAVRTTLLPPATRTQWRWSRC